MKKYLVTTQSYIDEGKLTDTFCLIEGGLVVNIDRELRYTIREYLSGIFMKGAVYPTFFKTYRKYQGNLPIEFFTEKGPP